MGIIAMRSHIFLKVSAYIAANRIVTKDGRRSVKMNKKGKSAENRGNPDPNIFKQLRLLAHASLRITQMETKRGVDIL